MLPAILLLLGLLAFSGFYFITTYNKLIGYRIEAENGWSQIDVQLKRRHDLIPNLVSAVQGVMKFERETLTEVMAARNRAMEAGNAARRMKAEGEISGLLGRLMAVWENYPDLKSNENAMRLQEEITTTENRIAYTRGHYNDISANLNALTEQFPSCVVAGLAGIRKKEYFRAAESEKTAPKIQL